MPNSIFAVAIMATSATFVCVAADVELSELTKRAEAFCAELPDNERTDCVGQTLSKWQSPEHVAMMKDARRYADEILGACKNDNWDRFRSCSAGRLAKLPEATRSLAGALASLDNISRSAKMEEQRMTKARAYCNRVGITKETARIGMTTQTVLDCGWGEPDRVNRTVTATGVREQWVYDDGSYLYFDNGKLTAIQD